LPKACAAPRKSFARPSYNALGELECASETRLNVGVAIGVLEAVMDELMPELDKA
jgi:hypothetical protein